MTSLITLIAASSRDAVISVDDRLPWHYPADLRHFQEYTMGKPVIMGRKTLETLPGQKALPGRTNIVLSRDPGTLSGDLLGASSLNDALRLAGDVPEVCVIGGAQVYAQFLPIAHKLVITQVDCVINLNHSLDEKVKYFPIFDGKQWQRVSITPIGKKLEVHEFFRTPTNPITGKPFQSVGSRRMIAHTPAYEEGR